MVKDVCSPHVRVMQLITSFDDYLADDLVRLSRIGLTAKLDGSEGFCRPSQGSHSGL